MGSLRRIAPIFAVRDLGVAMAHYERLGFATRVHHGGGYGYATRDGIEIHLGAVPAQDQGSGSAYLFVDDADELARQWRSAGAEVHSTEASLRYLDTFAKMDGSWYFAERKLLVDWSETRPSTPGA